MICSIQDIAGCRLTVSDIADQGRVVQSLSSLFEDTIIVDRRENPSHGYRAVHVIVKLQAKMIEIQVRTSLQHMWAELSEKLSDISDPAIKYGGGDEETRKNLADTSNLVALSESLETQLAHVVALFSEKGLVEGKHQEIDQLMEHLSSLRRNLFDLLREYIKDVEDVKGGG